MRHLKHAHRARGVTLVEIVVAMAVGAILLATAAPSFSDYMTNARLRENGHLLLTEALMAQSEAIKRNTSVRLSTSGSTIQVIDLSVPAAPVLLRERLTSGGVTLPTSALTFGSEGRPVPFGTSAAIDLSAAGVICSADARCPGLRVDAGGAVRLCSNQQSCS
jgi:type IV fimbrial biogenesis protein FimT